MIRGAVYRVDLGQARGHEQRGNCLGLVVSPVGVASVGGDSGCHLEPAGPAIRRPELEIAGRTTRLLVDQIRSIGVDYIQDDPVDYLTRDQLAQVDFAIAHCLGDQDATALRRYAGPD